MNWQELAWQFQSKSDWTGMTPKELRIALEGAIIASVYSNVPPSQHADCLAYHENEIDFAMYSMIMAAFPFSDNPEWSLKEVVERLGNRTFDNNAKRNCFVGYTNTYFYKYIHDVELHKLAMIVESNDGLSLQNAVDFFITSILYPGLLEANPGMLVTYNMIDGIQQSRVQSLKQISADLQRAFNNDDQVGLFKNIFFLMTNFAGTQYRGVHVALLSIFGIEMAQYREDFYRNLPSLIENQGAITIGEITR